jgi:hypothetical protein
MIRPALGIVFLVLLAGTAQARPRDEAMARAYRCAAQPATRIWLDCYYGAAQPVRAALGMAPAPPAQAQLSETSPGPGQPADLQQRDAAMAEAARCADLAEDRAWLSCFYAATNPVRAVLALPPLQGAVPVMARKESVPAPQRSKGFLASVFGGTVIEARGRMVRYSFNAHNNFTVTLDNGQTWRQLDGDLAIADWHKPAGTYLVTITNGALGSHNLTVKNAPGMFKVQPVS